MYTYRSATQVTQPDIPANAVIASLGANSVARLRHGSIFSCLSPALLVASILSLAGASAYAQAGKGAIIGRVQNEVTGQYLNNARVSVKGTDLLTLTDDTGSYRLVNVPTGSQVLEIYYTGLDLVETRVEVTAGGKTEYDARMTSVARYGSDSSLVRMDPFKVRAAQETDAQTIAINEQRFSPNMKSVVSTETLGDSLGGQIGDVLRFLPGVASASGTVDTTGVIIRGFPSTMSVVSLDGAQLASSETAPTRAFETSQVTIQSVTRVEVTKVPLPSTGADTMAGSLNMVSKSAFERSRAQLKISVGLTTDDRFSLKKTPFQDNTRTYKIFPDFNFDLTLPITKNFGLVVTGLHAETAQVTDQIFQDSRGTTPGTTASPASPYMWRLRNTQVLRQAQRDSFSAKADWRPGPSTTLSFTAVINYYDSLSYSNQFNPSAGTNGTSTVAGGRDLSYTPESTFGATGRGAMDMTMADVRRIARTPSGDLHYRFDNGTWKVDAAGNYSRSRLRLRFEKDGKGFFQAAGITPVGAPVRVDFTGIGPGKTAQFKVYDSSNREIDPYDIDNFNITSATLGPVTNQLSTIGSGKIDIRRTLNFLPFPAKIGFGGLSKRWIFDIHRVTAGVINYNGINGNRSAAPYLADVFNGELPLAHTDPVRYPSWVSMHKLYKAWQDNPSLFTQTPAQLVAITSGEILQSKVLREDTTAAYLQGEARVLQGRLQLVSGFRFEKTEDTGAGPLRDVTGVFVRSADGSFTLTPAGARIRKPEAGVAGSLTEVPFIYKERGVHVERSYNGYYPSLHANYNITPKFMARAAYAKTYGRPDFQSLMPNTFLEVDDTGNTDPNAARGRITVSNISLKPWAADNYDLSLEYYTNQGGFLSGGVFLKDVRNFFGSQSIIATEADVERLDLDPRYVGWLVTTTFNTGDARVKGAEMSVRHSLAPLGRWGWGQWGRFVNVFANVTKLRLEGDQFANFSGFLPLSATWGATVTKGPVIVSAKWNYRDVTKGPQYPDMGPDAFRYALAMTQMDMNLNYQLTKRTLFFANIRNVTDAERNENQYGSQTPASSKGIISNSQVYGRIYTVGIKGAF